MKKLLILFLLIYCIFTPHASKAQESFNAQNYDEVYALEYDNNIIIFKKDGKYGWYDSETKKVYNVKSDTKPQMGYTRWFTPLTVKSAILYKKNGFNRSSIDGVLIPVRIVLFPIELPVAAIHDLRNLFVAAATLGMIAFVNPNSKYCQYWLAKEIYK